MKFWCDIMEINNNNKEEQTLTFIAEWFDSHPQVTRQYLLKFYPSTNEVEMKDTSTRTKFLKRTKVDNESISVNDFHIGSTVILFARDLKLVDYGDNQTRKLLESSMETSIVVLTPRIAFKVGSVIKTIEDSGLVLVNLKSFHLEDDVIAETSFVLGLEEDELKWGCHKSTKEEGTKGGGLKDMMNFGIAIEFRGENCIQKLLELQSILRHDLRQQLLPLLSPSSSNKKLLLVTSPSEDSTKIYKDLFLACKHKPTAAFLNEANYCFPNAKGENVDTSTTRSRTCCVIKTHVIKSRQAGAIINEIVTRGHAISAMQIFYLDRSSAKEFYEVYKTAVKDYHSLIDEICSGPVIALEIQCDDAMAFREDVAGPWDVEMAKSLSPDTIRAKYGVSNIQNAIHCTDLPEEIDNELSYFFDILQNVDDN